VVELLQVNPAPAVVVDARLILIGRRAGEERHLHGGKLLLQRLDVIFEGAGLATAGSVDEVDTALVGKGVGDGIEDGYQWSNADTGRSEHNRMGGFSTGQEEVATRVRTFNDVALVTSCETLDTYPGCLLAQGAQGLRPDSFLTPIR
jgi:hypothetical protein